jgi:hypothetical protein
MLDMTLKEWIIYGMDRGFCSDSVCATHEGVPNTSAEEAEWEKGYDPCIPAVRIWIND